MPAKSNASLRKLSKRELACRDDVGTAFAEIALEGEDGPSMLVLLLRKQFNEAINGNLQAIRKMVKILEANLKERKRQAENSFDSRLVRRHTEKPKPRLKRNSADLAMLILEIGLVDNAALQKGGVLDDPNEESRVRKVEPTRLAGWTAALRRPPRELDERQLQDILERHVVDEDDPSVSAWHAVKPAVIAGRVNLSGPEATRFKPGQSGNPRGRPAKQDTHDPAEEPQRFPYDDFLMEPVEFLRNGKTRLITRLDKLMVVLTAKAVQGDQKIEGLMVSLLMKFQELRWFQPERFKFSPEFVEFVED